MRKPYFLIPVFLLFIVSFMFTSCTTSGFHASVNTTQVQLNEGNYRIIARSVRGQAQARYILGLSYSYGINSHTLGLIPLDKERNLYSMAMENLWTNFEAREGSSKGRRLALTNIRYDAQALNLLFYVRPELVIVADVVEFD
jgi:hypothetical protein